MSNNGKDFSDFLGMVVGGVVLVLGLIFLITVIFGDNSCSKPKKQELEYGSIECSNCEGTGYISSQKVKVGYLGEGYVNEKCPICNGTGMYRVVID